MVHAADCWLHVAVYSELYIPGNSHFDYKIGNCPSPGAIGNCPSPGAIGFYIARSNTINSLLITDWRQLDISNLNRSSIGSGVGQV